ncbi:MAG: acylphosphatase [Desulfovibrionaceae bacterium]
MIRSMHCVVSGKVQGVFFRAWVQDQATALGVNGWVRNLAQGQIEALAQGDESALELFRERLRTGSPISRTDALDVKWIEYDKAYEGFEIR